MIKKIFKLFSWLIVGLIFYFLLKSLWGNWNQIKEYQFQINPFYLFISFILYFLAMFLLSQIWHFILTKQNSQKSRWEIFRIHFLSNFGKYIPGKVWLFLIRLKLGKKIGLSKKIVLVSSVLEIALGLTALGLISVFFLNHISLNQQYFFANLILLAIALIFILYPKLFYSVLNYLLGLVKKEKIAKEFQLKSSHLLILISVALISWFFWGLSFYFFTQALIIIPINKVFNLIGIFIVSYLIGFLALFAPNGLAVREGVQIYFLSSFLPLEIAILISLAYRIWITLNELVIALLVFLKNISNNQKM